MKSWALALILLAVVVYNTNGNRATLQWNASCIPNVTYDVQVVGPQTAIYNTSNTSITIAVNKKGIYKALVRTVVTNPDGTKSVSNWCDSTDATCAVLKDGVTASGWDLSR